MTEELVNVSDLNQYIYCPRRYWYLNFYDTQGRNYERVEGKSEARKSVVAWELVERVVP